MPLLSPSFRRTMKAGAASLTSNLNERAAVGHRYRDPFRSGRRTPKARHAQLLSRPPTFLATILILVLLAITPAAAVRIPFSNCLDDSYRLRDPRPLQWEPLYADAVFETGGEKNNLQVIVWGNVSGSFSSKALPAPEDPYWSNDDETAGKIIQTPEPDKEKPKATTLVRRIDVLTFELWNEGVDFCVDGLADGACPLSPVFNTDDM